MEISKKFSLGFQDETFSIKPPKLDSFMSRQAKNCNRLKAVSAAEKALISSQLKIMYIAPPLIDLYAKIVALGEGEAEDQAYGAAQAILQKWGRAYQYSSQRRRLSVESLVNPTFDYLLSTSLCTFLGRSPESSFLRKSFCNRY